MRPLPSRHMGSWVVLIALLLLATFFVATTAPELPPNMASHFDAAGRPTAFMSRSVYVRFVCGLSIVLPLLIVAMLRTAYRRATVLKLPNRDYWLAAGARADTLQFVHAVKIRAAEQDRPWRRPAMRPARCSSCK